MYSNIHSPALTMIYIFPNLSFSPYLIFKYFRVNSKCPAISQKVNFNLTENINVNRKTYIPVKSGRVIHRGSVGKTHVATNSSARLPLAIRHMPHPRATNVHFAWHIHPCFAEGCIRLSVLNSLNHLPFFQNHVQK